METKKKKKQQQHAVDVQELPASPDDDRRGIGRCAAVAVFCAATAFLVSLSTLVAELTVLNPYDPTITLVSVGVESYTPSVAFLPGGCVNVTLHLDLLLHNPNRERFEHEPGGTRFGYRGRVVGEADVAAGSIPGRGSAHVKCDVTVLGSGFKGRLHQLLEDVERGTVRFDASSKIVGSIVRLGFLRRRCVAASECHVDVAVGPPQLRVVRHRCG